MAKRMVQEYIDILQLMDSSDEEDIIMIPPPPLEPFVDKDEDDYNELHNIFHPVFGMIQRIEHVKIVNYVENIVQMYNNVDFIMHFRISREIAYELIGKFNTSEIFTSLQDTAGRVKITAEKHILCYLWFVGHESASYRDVADRFGITLSALHKIITRVSDFIMSMAPDIIRYPTAGEKEETAAFFYQTKAFPNVIGAIDGSHIRIDRPTEDPNSYINRKQYFSLHMQGTVNHQMKFIDVFIGYPGSVHDARVFANSSIRHDLHQLCGDNYYLLGDSAYPCLKQLIVPYKDNGHLTRAQRTFNQKLSSCRVVAENVFGCLKQRFRQLYHCKLRDIVRMVCVIHACCVLHNIANANDLEILEPPMDEQYDIEALRHVEIDVAPREEQTGVHIRDEICRQLSRQ